MKIYSDNTQSIGNTPLVRLNKITAGIKGEVLAKIEGRNPAYSVKCRIGASMVWDAEEQGILKEGMEIIEATSGNTGIALAFVAAARGYKVTLCMPSNMSSERCKILKAFGANLIQTDPERYMVGAIEKAKELIKQRPDHYFMPMQFENPANPNIHEKTTGPEIWNDTEGNIDAFVAGIGTGGTITGVSRYIKRVQKKMITVVGVEPEESAIISQTLEGGKETPGFHCIQGIGAGFVPKNLDLNILDRMEKVNSCDAINMACRLAKEEGILCGISCGAATIAALRIASEDEFEGKRVVVIFPDTGERYLSTRSFES